MRKYLTMLFMTVLALIAYTGMAVADVTITNEKWSMWGNKRAKIMDVAFDSSYVSGGESLTPSDVNMSTVEDVIILPKSGYAFEYDFTNQKIKVFAKAPPVVYEEQHTVSGNSIYLRYPAALLVNVAQANSNLKIVTSGATVIATTDECQPIGTWSDGARSGVTFGTTVSGTVYVTYVTQAWKEVWENVVQNETVTISGDSGFFTYPAAAIQAATLLGSSYTNAAAMMDKDDPASTGGASIDWSGSGGLTGISTFAANGISSAVVTYVKNPTFGILSDNWVEEETAANTAGTSKFVLNNTVILWGYSGQVPITGVSTARLINDRGTTGTDEAYISYRSGTSPWEQLTVGANSAPTTATYVKGFPGDVETGLLEVPGLRNLSGLTGVKVIMVGR